MNVIRMDRRTVAIHVPRAALAAASENALAASRNVADALERAQAYIWTGNRAGLVHELSRIGHEVEGRTEALANLARLAESAAECPDGVAAPSHGAAA